MKKLKKIALWAAFICSVVIILAYTTGNQHLFKAVSTTYLVGKTGPSIDEYKIFENRTVKKGNHIPWKLGASYNENNKLIDWNRQDTLSPAAMLVIQNNEIIYEWYGDEYSEVSYTNSFSMAKSYIGMLVGIAIDEGYIKSVNDKVGDYLPMYKDYPELKVVDLLTMSSGINFDESYGSPFGHMAKAYYGTDLKKLNTNYSVVKEPGKDWEYRGGNTLILSFIIEKVTGKTVSEYMSEKVWSQVGAKNDAFWSLDHKDGNEKAYCCFNSNTRDFARIGKLYMDFGIYNGKQLLDSAYIAKSVVPASYLVDSEGNNIDCYGYQWWMGTHKNVKYFYARGMLGQYTICIPEKNMIIVRLGHKRSKKYLNHHTIDLFTYLDFGLKLAK